MSTLGPNIPSISATSIQDAPQTFTPMYHEKRPKSPQISRVQSTDSLKRLEQQGEMVKRGPGKISL